MYRVRELVAGIGLALVMNHVASPARAQSPVDVPAEAEASPGAMTSAPADAAADVPPIHELSGVTVRGQYEAGDSTLYLDERRESANVTEALGAQQIARTGDSDVATTLRRVTGLSLVDGKYVYVRGLGERYSSVLLNGARIPSPDYTRRVVPLDLFPTELLDGVIVQKSYSPDMPGEFGGGTVGLRTREIPSRFFFRASGTLGYADGTTGEDGLRYYGGGSDWTGRDDGQRAMPDSLAGAIANNGYLRPYSSTNPGGATPGELQAYGRDLAAAGFGIHTDRIGPDGGFSLGIGNGFKFGDDIRLGVVASTRYQQSWDVRSEQRHTYAAGNSGLNLTAGQDVDSTERHVDAGFFLGAGLQIGNAHRLGLTSMLLRQSNDRARISDGTVDSVDSRFFEQKWIENHLRVDQLDGSHSFQALHDLQIDWQYTHASAGRDEPDTRRWRYDHVGDLLEFSRRSDSNSQTFGRLDDSQDDAGIKASLPFDFDNGSALTLSGGYGRLERDRDASIRTFQYGLAFGSPLPSDPDFFLQPIDAILQPDNIRPDGFVLREVTRATDNYRASQVLDSAFFNLDFDMPGAYRIDIGARHESNRQDVTTFSVLNANTPPVVASDDSSRWLPSAGFTWRHGENGQVRFGYSRTLSRPDFRELSGAPFTDPELDIDTIGNPDLETTRIRNLDLRWEYYLSEADSLSVALFDKRFDAPIERIRLPGSSPLASFANALGAHNYGIELDASSHLGFVRRWWDVPVMDDLYVGFNYARIKSTVELDPASASYQTNLTRPMQGQSPYVVNFQLGYVPPDGRFEATLLFNRFGRRISEVGVQRQPDIYEEAFNALDLQFRQRFARDWRWTLRLRNLLDPAVRYTQGGLPTREYRRGREVLFSLEWRPGAQ